MSRGRRIALLVGLLLGAVGCAALQQYAALAQVAFSLDGVADARLAGVPVARIASYRDLSATEVATLVTTVGRGNAPFEFTARVGAANPGTNRTDARLARMEWLLLLDGRETVRGVLDTSYTLPAGQPVTIPLRVHLDLREFFGGGVQEIVNLAAGIAGLRNDPTRVTLELTPQIETPLGPLSPPTPIRVTGRTP